ncbi:MAG TPA: hypothetical protein VND70_10485 [Acidimicrobiales bacterium]|nr:hypothetical protein [Acidimicrobiales bacterium]
MLLLHEVHRVAGAHEEAFDRAWREEFLPALGRGDDARLLWYLRLAHGSGAAYTVVTITGCRDALAWSALAERVRQGDLADWSSRVDAMRHRCEAKILTPVRWSPRQEIDLVSVPTSGEEHELTLFMEDTAWPFPGALSAYLDQAGTLYDRTLAQSKDGGRSIIELEAAYQPVYGSHKTTEVILWQRVVNHKALLYLLANELPPSATAPGTWMHDALAVRDQWESRILRSASWSPLY